MKKKKLFPLLLSAVATLALAGPTPAPEGVNLYFTGLEDGAEVTSPVTVSFGLSGMGIAPAGVEHPNTGHHHLLLNVDELPDMDMPIPADEHHIHFGGGQTEVQLELEPGTHTLQLLLGDHFHIPHNPPVMSESISIVVE
ncbi:MAG: DUF4399 domain-containing protein [Anaerolineaceae bacterium]|nr:DUF4399 domain-containing protein [Anaerolineaceae bacterium]